eukprot:TRINITY_DN5301_c0_g1_i11.p3 TRINITY_DN5301_c0_g1~~TRINITY_DN5301_c0_g1_i11.p3  ORF type:complete len:117 (+),score=1.47 TRINITY_DN5301_c0_g1_i11:377-727(+)
MQQAVSGHQVGSQSHSQTRCSETIGDEFDHNQPRHQGQWSPIWQQEAQEVEPMDLEPTNGETMQERQRQKAIQAEVTCDICTVGDQTQYVQAEHKQKMMDYPTSTVTRLFSHIEKT